MQTPSRHLFEKLIGVANAEMTRQTLPDDTQCFAQLRRSFFLKTTSIFLIIIIFMCTVLLVSCTYIDSMPNYQFGDI